MSKWFKNKGDELYYERMTRKKRAGGKQTSTFTNISVDVEKIGGIETASLPIDRGVTVFTGRNATNRTSLFRAISGALGGTGGILKRDAESGSVSLAIDGERYTRRYTREGGSVRTHGTPFTDEQELVDLFVCLLEDNSIRRAVRAGEDLSELLLAPLDTDKLESKVVTLQSERDQIDERLNEIEREQKRLPKLEEQRRERRTQLDEIESELETVREHIEPIGGDVVDGDQAEAVIADLEQTQTELERTESEIGTQRNIREGLRADLVDVREELSELDVRKEKLSELDHEIDRLQGRESTLSATINELSTILKQNKGMVTSDDAAVRELAIENDTLSELDLMGQSIECWTCGSRVERRAIADRLEDIEELVEAKRADQKQLREILSERKSHRESIRREAQRHQKLKERQAELERELQRRADAIEELTSETEALRDEIAEHKAELESMEEVTDSEKFGEYERLSELEYERGRIEQELQDIEDDINEVEYLLGKHEDLEARREDLTEQIRSLRSRVEELEKTVVDTFNTHMESVLERLAYENVERVWVERRKMRGETTFDLHIIREDESGTAYEDAVDHLSESEREVVGLIVALTGYLTYDIQKTVPIILLDSLEAIDGTRIAELIDHFRSHTDYLLLALLEEDAAALPDSYDRVYAEESLTGDGSS